MAETPAEAYDRGHTAGEVASTLRDHAKHLAKINGSMDVVASELHALNLAVQRLGDDSSADRTRVVATAAALKEAEEARRQTAEQSWTPLARVSVLVGIVAAVIATALGIWLAVRPI